jgi:hypothetical protein
MQQLADEGGGGGDRSTQVAKRIKTLEKELHTYKKLVRELRSKREHEEEVEDRYRDPDHRSRRTYDNEDQRNHHHREASHGHDPRGQGRVVHERERTHPSSSSRHRQPLDETPRRRGGFRNEDDLERIEVVGGGGGGEGDSDDDGESTVSQIQPSHILQFQRRLARLHR